MIKLTATIVAALLFTSVSAQEQKAETSRVPASSKYVTIGLETDESLLDESEKLVLRELLLAAYAIDGIFWKQACAGGDKAISLTDDPEVQLDIRINYGFWDRLNGDQPLLPGIGPKPAGAGFYPPDMTIAEFEAWNDPIGKSPYSMVVRDSQGKLQATWYHEYFAEEIAKATFHLRRAAELTKDDAFRAYLLERATALETDKYGASEILWLAMKDNHLDIIIGPIENYEDKLLGLKTSYESYVLVKDMEWSKRLGTIAGLLPELQKKLPVEEAYKSGEVGSQSQLAAYDALFYAGDCNSGSKTIAVNLPNDEDIQQQFGTRRSQLKNVMQAKYENILVPIANLMIAPDQLQYISFDAFFRNVMFHEVAHGLGVKYLVKGKGTVREALREQYSALEEEKADVLGLWMLGELYESGKMYQDEANFLESQYVTFVAGIFRSCRFGTSSAHGKANMHTFNFLIAERAIYRDKETGLYKVEFNQMKTAIAKLAGQILRLQGDGDYNVVKDMMAREAVIGPELQAELNRLMDAGIPVDIVFKMNPVVAEEYGLSR